MTLTHDDVQEVLRLLDASFHDEMHLETKGFKLSLRRAGSAPGLWTREATVLGAPNLLNPAAEEVPPSSSAPGAGGPIPPQSALAPGMTAILPPLIGTFYRAPKPGAAPFVDLGSRVEPDTVVGIIETMKLMNPVMARTSGTVAEIHARDGELVESDQILMVVAKEPA